MSKVSYKKGYINLSRNDLLYKLKQEVSEFRFQHILSVEETALKLAVDQGYTDYEKISIAALMHDYCKDMAREEMYEMAYAYYPSSNLAQGNDSIWHAYAASYYAQRHYGVDDLEILEAISQHTIGGKEMTLLSKILFVADYIEPLRSFKKVDKAREKAKKSLDHAAFYKMRQTIKHLAKNSETIYMESVENYNYWVKKKKENLLSKTH